MTKKQSEQMKKVWNKRKEQPEELKKLTDKISKSVIAFNKENPAAGKNHAEWVRKDRKEHPEKYVNSLKAALQNTSNFNKLRVGKTYMEIYGKEKAMKISEKQKQSKLRKPTKYWLGKKREPEIGEAIRKSKKGKTIEQIMGKRNAQIWAEKHLNYTFPKKDTSIEKKVQYQLKKAKMTFLTHYPITGQPDMLLTEYNLAIFCDGCYWHGCPQHFPNKKQENYNRDLRIMNDLKLEGYDVIRLWEHDIKEKDFDILYYLEKVINKNKLKRVRA